MIGTVTGAAHKSRRRRIGLRRLPHCRACGSVFPQHRCTMEPPPKEKR